MIDDIPDTCKHGIWPVGSCTICNPKPVIDDNSVEFIDVQEK